MIYFGIIFFLLFLSSIFLHSSSALSFFLEIEHRVAKQKRFFRIRSANERNKTRILLFFFFWARVKVSFEKRRKPTCVIKKISLFFLYSVFMAVVAVPMLRVCIILHLNGPCNTTIITVNKKGIIFFVLSLSYCCFFVIWNRSTAEAG